MTTDAIGAGAGGTALRSLDDGAALLVTEGGGGGAVHPRLPMRPLAPRRLLRWGGP